ncbi:hypothetical protein A2188_03315 [Candidatus Woesebacteria bacterium RIFOXYA1_FULL_43_9]|uniref:Uncharacterized protein n=1 Tax=Candidatus Woesebacteria bacterium RIFOXYA1_FULL_43_9 TaxID=1802534 RepID=A0A1F8CN67_9BACT|nr:MAG: hypothetical protein A2188_03315 [Candidatus Woesebacteria bacterium RIFOXYA1_FULL_43_9]
MNLPGLAIDFALEANWCAAIKTNRTILRQNPQDIDALTRLTRAFLETGNLRQAKKALKTALEIDPANPIAKRLTQKMKAPFQPTDRKATICDTAFIDKGPLTHTYRVVINKNTVEAKNILPGEYLILNLQGFCISILSSKGKFLGRLNGYTSQMIKKQIGKKTPPDAVVKSLDENIMEIVLLPKKH